MSSECLEHFVGRQVVLDLVSRYIVLGTLAGADPLFFRLENADVHDLRESPSTRDLYAVEARRNGIRVNRRMVLIRREEVAAVAALDDVEG